MKAGTSRGLSLAGTDVLVLDAQTTGASPERGHLLELGWARASGERAATPEARLLVLMRLLKEERLARYDVAVRAWAAQELIFAEGVQQVDRQRFGYVRQIFHDMGFRGADLDTRTRLFVVYHIAEPGMRLPASGLASEAELRQRLAFFVRP